MRISNEQIREWYKIFMKKSLVSARADLSEVDFASFFFTVNKLNELRLDGQVNILGVPVTKYKIANKFADLLIANKKIKYDNSSCYHNMMKFALLDGHSEIESSKYNEGADALVDIVSKMEADNQRREEAGEKKLLNIPQGKEVRILDVDEFERVQKLIEMKIGCSFTFNNITEAGDCGTFGDVKNRVVVNGKLPVESTTGCIPVILKPEMIAFIDGSFYNFSAEEEANNWFRNSIKIKND